MRLLFMVFDIGFIAIMRMMTHCTRICINLIDFMKKGSNLYTVLGDSLTILSNSSQISSASQKTFRECIVNPS